MNAAKPALSEVQRRFQESLLNPRPCPPDFLAHAAGVPAAEHFGIYHEAYRLRLVEALQADYPALAALLGAEGFASMGRAYAETYPSRHPSIRWFGANLPQFLSISPLYRDRPELADLAAFEWALSEAFDAADAPVVSHRELAALPVSDWPHLQIRFHPSLRPIDLRLNTPQVWRALTHQQTPPNFEILDRPKTWMVWRFDLKLLFRSLPPLDPPEHFAFEAMSGGLCFAELCEGLCDFLPEEQVPETATRFLSCWIADGWIAAIDNSPRAIRLSEG